MSTGREVKPDTMKIRLHQFLSKTGVFTSKRAVKDAIWAGDVTVNGSVVKDIAFQFKPNKKEVCYRGQRLSLPSTERCFVLNKPKGVVCSRLNSQEREFGKQSVFELFRPHLPDHDFERLITVGRLDEDTTGLLLVTTDGTLAHRIASPDHHVSKRYAVTTAQSVSDADLERLRAGVDIELETNGEVEVYTTQPARVESGEHLTTIITIAEGKKRQVRRMFGALGHEVVALERWSIGGLHLAEFNLDEGSFTELNANDVSAIVFQT